MSSTSQKLKESLIEYSSKYLAHTVKLTQYHQLICKMTRHRAEYVFGCTGRLTMQHSKAQDSDLIVGFVYAL